MKKFITKSIALFGALLLFAGGNEAVAQTALTVTVPETSADSPLNFSFKPYLNNSNSKHNYFELSKAITVSGNDDVPNTAFAISWEISSENVQTSNTSLPQYLKDQQSLIEKGGVTISAMDDYYQTYKVMMNDYGDVPDLVTVNDNDSFNINMSQIYCSGLYKVTVAPAAGYSFDTQYIYVNIYPDPTYIYGTGQAEGSTTGYVGSITLNIDGIPQVPADADYNGTITFPYVSVTTEDGTTKQEIFNQANLEHSHIYTPGLYFADIEYALVEETSAMALSDLSFTTYSGDTGINLSGLISGKSYVLYIKMNKFGASTPNVASFRVTASTAAPLPTGVDKVEACEEEAVFYNLQGVKVSNPSHGIFVKVAGGKTQKVVL